MSSDNPPIFALGIVTKGFGRGSKELGIPTANLDEHVIERHKELKTGVYFGWAQVDKSEIYKMVMSVGWNPFYRNTKKSMEVHIIKEFDSDFYGSELRICIAGYIRQEMDFKSVGDLIRTIRDDIEKANNELATDQMKRLITDKFWLTKINNNGS